MNMKEELLRQKKEVDDALRAIAAKEREKEERAAKQAMITNGLLTPLKHATVKEDIYWCSGDEKIVSEGYGVASDFLRGPSFDRGERLVLIKSSSGELIWVPYQASGDYSGSERDTYISNDEIYDMLEILP